MVQFVQLMSATHDALTAVSAATRAEEILAVESVKIKQAEKQTTIKKVFC